MSWRLVAFLLLLGLAAVTVFNFHALLQAMPDTISNGASRVVDNIKNIIYPRGDSEAAKFVKNIGVLLQNTSMENDGRSFRELAVHTRGAISVVQTSIQSISRMEGLDDQEHSMLEQANVLVQRLSDIETRTHSLASSNHRLFVRFADELVGILTSFTAGDTTGVLHSLKRIEEAISNTLSDLSQLQTQVTRATDDTRELKEQAIGCMEHWKARAKSNAGTVVYPPATVALVTLTTTIVTFTAVSFAPFAAVATKAALSTAAITTLLGIGKQQSQDALAGEMQAHASDLGHFALATQTIIQGLVRLNQSLDNMHRLVKDSQQATHNLKGAAHEEDVRQFTFMVNRAKSDFTAVAGEAERVLREWTNDA
jgi:hypothetical protein